MGRYNRPRTLSRSNSYPGTGPFTDLFHLTFARGIKYCIVLCVGIFFGIKLHKALGSPSIGDPEYMGKNLMYKGMVPSYIGHQNIEGSDILHPNKLYDLRNDPHGMPNVGNGGKSGMNIKSHEGGISPERHKMGVNRIKDVLIQMNGKKDTDTDQTVPKMEERKGEGQVNNGDDQPQYDDSNDMAPDMLHEAQPPSPAENLHNKKEQEIHELPVQRFGHEDDHQNGIDDDGVIVDNDNVHNDMVPDDQNNPQNNLRPLRYLKQEAQYVDSMNNLNQIRNQNGAQQRLPMIDHRGDIPQLRNSWNHVKQSQDMLQQEHLMPDRRKETVGLAENKRTVERHEKYGGMDLQGDHLLVP